jgi:hypothetical protein
MPPCGRPAQDLTGTRTRRLDLVAELRRRDCSSWAPRRSVSPLPGQSPSRAARAGRRPRRMSRWPPAPLHPGTQSAKGEHSQFAGYFDGRGGFRTCDLSRVNSHAATANLGHFPCKFMVSSFRVDPRKPADLGSLWLGLGPRGSMGPSILAVPVLSPPDEQIARRPGCSALLSKRHGHPWPAVAARSCGERQPRRQCRSGDEPEVDGLATSRPGCPLGWTGPSAAFS